MRLCGKKCILGVKKKMTRSKPLHRYVVDPRARYRASLQQINDQRSRTALSGGYKTQGLHRQIEKLRHYPRVSI